MNRLVFVSIIILCLLSVSSITGLIHLAKAAGATITINADGSITPSTAPITTVDNTTYTFRGNVNESIVVERDNIVLSGARGYTVQGTVSITGITLSGISNVTIKSTEITRFSYGIILDSSSSSIFGNNITANNGYGIVLISSSSSSIYHNNFVKNTQQVYSIGSINAWDEGYPSGGNYWSDYVARYPNASEIDASGVWNTPYVIDANNTDYYPLTVPYAVVPEFPSFLILPLFMIATLLAVIIYKKKGMKTRQS